MNLTPIQAMAIRMAKNAKDGTLIVDGVKYALTFDRETWLYRVRDPGGAEITNFNTKSLKQARQWLREWLSK